MLFKSITDLLSTFPNEQTCIKYLEFIRWKGEITSPFTTKEVDKLRDELGSLDVSKEVEKSNQLLTEISSYKVYKYKDGRYKCAKTKKYFNVRTGTMFDNSKVPLRKWFIAIYLVTTHKKGISSVRLAEHIGVTQKTAWFMIHRIRNCCNIQHAEQMGGVVEADETFVGGKNANRHANKKVEKSHGRSYKDKTPVLGILERETKQVKLIAIPNTSKEYIQPLIYKYVKKGSTFYSDEWRGYAGLHHDFNHKILDHKSYEYVSGDDNQIHTNTIEGFWTIFKRGYMGVYHKMTRKHLQKYCHEFAFRYNTNHLPTPEKFALLLSNMDQRLTYKTLIEWNS